MKVKVCGMRDQENIRQVSELMPDYLGFNFYSNSKRYVGEDFEIPDINMHVQTVGVFVNASKAFVMKQVKEYHLDYVQLHGDESPKFCKELSNEDIPVIKAFGINEQFDLQMLKSYKPYCQFFLFDTKTAQYGGSGSTFNWQLLDNYEGETPFFLAGGISLENLEAIKDINHKGFYAIDINSGFEIKPGLKDIVKVEKLLNDLRVAIPPSKGAGSEALRGM